MPTPSPSPTPLPSVTVRVGLPSTGPGGWAYYAADRAHLASGQNLRIDLSYHDTPDKTAQALNNGAIDLAGLPTDAAILAIDRNASLKIVAAQQAHAAQALLVARDVLDFEGLRGRPVAIGAPNEVDTALLKRLLATHGLKDGDVTLVPLGEPDRRGGGVMNGSVAAALLPAPRLFEFTDRGFRTLGSASEVTQAYQAEVLVARADWPAKNESAMTRFLHVLAGADAWLNDASNRQGAATALSDNAKLPAQIADRLYQLYVEQARAVPRTPEVDPAGLRAVIEMMREVDLLKAPLPGTEKYLDPSPALRLKQHGGA
ncbi:MAG: ABC transporter substrate-binding protein [Chloroflexi bacterium]|nr:ABC transporter substrate-binding protein [Chloroflexota bacterium]